MRSMPTRARSPRWRPSFSLGLATVLTLAVAPGVARGDDADAARAVELKQAGDQAMDSFHYADALAIYEKAYALSPRPALLYNEGRALQALNRRPEALAKLEAFKAAAPEDVLKQVPDLDKLLAELRARVGTLEVTCNVPGARVLVDHTVVATTPLAERLKLNAGALTLDVEAEGYLPFHQPLELKGAETLSVQARLTPNTNGVLIVDGSSPGAEVLIDDVRVGTAPAEQMVPAGTHRLLLRHPQFADTMASIVVEAGQRKQVTVPLRAKPVTSKWWFWTSLAAVAATAAVAGGVAAGVTVRGPDAGTIPPGRLTAQRSVGVRAELHF